MFLTLSTDLVAVIAHIPVLLIGFWWCSVFCV